MKLKLKPLSMRKILTFVAAMLITGSLLAGGLVTNTNQSAMFTRLQNRNASTDIDAVYYNPAGLTKLKDGFYASFNNQTITQTQTITNDYTYLSGTKPKEYIGDVSAPIYPGVYLAYKTGKFAFSAGVNVIGGGGGASFKTGLPSFEMPISDLVPGLSSQLAPLDNAFKAVTGVDPGFRNITGYNSAIYFKGSSAYLGYQANISYKINDMISAAIGGRYVSAKNTYQGYISSVTIDAPAAYGGTQTPGNYLRKVASIPGVPPATSAVLKGTATVLDSKTNVLADAVLEGSGFTPIISLNITPSEKLNISARYEFQTKMEMKTTVNDGKTGGIFIQDSVSTADMPAQLALGVNYSPVNKLTLSGSFNYYFDKNVDYDGQSDVDVNQIDDNFLEFGLGGEYVINEKMRVSAGWVHTITGVNADYQSDLRFSTNTNSFGGGLGYRVAPMLDINLGGQYTMYATDSETFNHNLGTIPIPVTQTYTKSTWLVAIGLDFYFGKSE
jgi:long-chain fatty acid transport protein